MSRDLELKVAQVVSEATDLASAATRVANMAQEALHHGGQLAIQSQMAFMVGCLMRLTKDHAIVEYKQQAGARVRPTRRNST